jgi:acyl-coenzyme A synthetase/AMP-(fatty) acid ligase
MTSGTTGRPKVATHSLPSLLSNVRASAHAQSDGGDRWLLTYQPTGFAGIQVMLTAVQMKDVIVTTPQRSPGAFYEAAVQGEVTKISGTPTFWRSFLMLVAPGTLLLRQITLGGEAADQATLDRLKRAFPSARITHTYASTEAGVVYAVHDGLAGFPAAWLEQPPKAIRFRVRDGFLQIKSANAMCGYVGESGQPFLEDGWLATADRCEIRGERAYIIGRDDSTINVAGSKVYPLEIENFLLSQPGVVEASVYGVPNPVSGFLVGASVVLAQDQDSAAARSSILAACRANLASYQVPRIFKIVESIRVSASGKKV